MTGKPVRRRSLSIDGNIDEQKFAILAVLREGFVVRLIHTAEIPTALSDPAFVCLVPRSLIAQSLKDERKREISELVMATVRWYGSVADVQPCIFNVAVDLYDTIQPLGVGLRSEAYDAFHQLYEEETLTGRDHHVSLSAAGRMPMTIRLSRVITAKITA